MGCVFTRQEEFGCDVLVVTPEVKYFANEFVAIINLNAFS